MLLPHSMDLIVTDRCNLFCPVCWGSNMPKFETPSLEKKLEILDILAKEGVKKVIFTGGEPLIEENLPRLVQHAKSLGLETLLFTNTILLKQKEQELMPYVDLMSVSLDGHNDCLNSIARKPGHFYRVLEAFELVADKYPDKRLQVITVVTDYNKRYLEEIGELLIEETQGLKFQWKLNYPQNIGRHNSQFSMDYSEFEECAKGAKKHFKNRLRVSYSPNLHDYCYSFVFPDGAVYTTEQERYIPIGNLFDLQKYDMKTSMKIENNMRLKHEMIKNQ